MLIFIHLIRLILICALVLTTHKLFEFNIFLVLSLYLFFWLLVYISFKLYSKRYYLTRKIYNFEMNYLLISSVLLLIVYVLNLSFASIEFEFNTSIVLIHVLSVMILFLPYITSLVLLFFRDHTKKNK